MGWLGHPYISFGTFDQYNVEVKGQTQSSRFHNMARLDAAFYPYTHIADYNKYCP